MTGAVQRNRASEAMRRKRSGAARLQAGARLAMHVRAVKRAREAASAALSALQAACRRVMRQREWGRRSAGAALSRRVEMRVYRAVFSERLVMWRQLAAGEAGALIGAACRRAVGTRRSIREREAREGVKRISAWVRGRLGRERYAQMQAAEAASKQLQTACRAAVRRAVFNKCISAMRIHSVAKRAVKRRRYVRAVAQGMLAIRVYARALQLRWNTTMLARATDGSARVLQGVCRRSVMRTAMERAIGVRRRAVAVLAASVLRGLEQRMWRRRKEGTQMLQACARRGLAGAARGRRAARMEAAAMLQGCVRGAAPRRSFEQMGAGVVLARVHRARKDRRRYVRAVAQGSLAVRVYARALRLRWRKIAAKSTLAARVHASVGRQRLEQQRGMAIVLQSVVRASVWKQRAESVRKAAERLQAAARGAMGREDRRELLERLEAGGALAAAVARRRAQEELRARMGAVKLQRMVRCRIERESWRVLRAGAKIAAVLQRKRAEAELEQRKAARRMQSRAGAWRARQAFLDRIGTAQRVASALRRTERQRHFHSVRTAAARLQVAKPSCPCDAGFSGPDVVVACRDQAEVKMGADRRKWFNVRCLVLETAVLQAVLRRARARAAHILHAAAARRLQVFMHAAAPRKKYRRRIAGRTLVAFAMQRKARAKFAPHVASVRLQAAARRAPSHRRFCNHAAGSEVFWRIHGVGFPMPPSTQRRCDVQS
eukprot:2597094-Rhodomonas_salina.2